MKFVLSIALCFVAGVALAGKTGEPTPAAPPEVLQPPTVIEQPAPACQCPKCCCDRSIVTTKRREVVVQRSRAQQLCEIRARHMARTGTRGHVLQHLGYGEGRMEGSGFSTSPHNVPTCVGSGAVLGDCTARGRDGYYRVRIYESGGSRIRSRRRRG